MPNFNTYETPFAATSLWYAKPKAPVLSTFVIPACYNPRNVISPFNLQFVNITMGEYSSGVYEAVAGDGPRTVYGAAGTMGVLDTDTHKYRPNVSIPRWPAGAVGAVGSDGHCDIIDEQANRVWSFFQLKQRADGEFTATQFSWAPLDGSGWGEGAHYAIGARATGVPTCAGMIRSHEINDGADHYQHVLACSLDQSALSAKPAYVLPATMSDWDPQVNTGQIPEGALLMLPASFNIGMFDRWPHVQKLVRTLMIYGARVVDRNERTPLAFYVQKGSNWSTMPGGVWDTQLANALEVMRAQVRMVSDAGGFTMPNGADWAPATRRDLMSARGPWRLEGQSAEANIYDSLNQRLQLPATGGKWLNGDGKGIMVPELRPVEGRFYKLYVDSDCGGSLNMTINYWPLDGTGPKKLITGHQTKWKEVFIRWPRDKGSWIDLEVYKPLGTAGYLMWRFIEVAEAEYLAGARKLSA